MDVKPHTLVVAIQCVAAVIKILDRRLEILGHKEAAKLEQLIVTFDLAEIDLKAAYEAALAQYGGLPAYEDLAAWSLEFEQKGNSSDA